MHLFCVTQKYIINASDNSKMVFVTAETKNNLKKVFNCFGGVSFIFGTEV